MDSYNLHAQKMDGIPKQFEYTNFYFYINSYIKILWDVHMY